MRNQIVVVWRVLPSICPTLAEFSKRDTLFVFAA